MELGIKVHYLHSEVETIERVGILRDLRLGVFDVVVGINLLREGLDLPEVSWWQSLGTDKGRFSAVCYSHDSDHWSGCPHLNGKVIMYADRMTDSMKFAIDETNRRRAKQRQRNEAHGIQPVSIVKAVHDLTERLTVSQGLLNPKVLTRQAGTALGHFQNGKFNG